ncbi:MAG: hypothetical protein ACOZAP_03440 [Pseudomonadota bacterium]
MPPVTGEDARNICSMTGGKAIAPVGGAGDAQQAQGFGVQEGASSFDQVIEAHF